MENVKPDYSSCHALPRTVQGCLTDPIILFKAPAQSCLSVSLTLQVAGRALGPWH